MRSFVRTVVAAALVCMSWSVCVAEPGPLENGGFWTLLDEFPAEVAVKPALVLPERFQAVRLDFEAFAKALTAAPMEFTPEAAEHPLVVALPMPDGSFTSFACRETLVLAWETRERLPGFRTYIGSSLGAPGNIHLCVSPAGALAQVVFVDGRVARIERAAHADVAHYVVCDRADLPRRGFHCASDSGVPAPGVPAGADPTLRGPGVSLRRLNIAVSCTSEYASIQIGYTGLANDDAASLVGVMETLHLVNQVFIQELAIRFQLIPMPERLFWDESELAHQPFTATDACGLGSQNQVYVTGASSPVQIQEFDVGHLFAQELDAGNRGCAGFGGLCNGSSKAYGCSIRGATPGDRSSIEETVCHELGHQLGAKHTFNSVAGVCGCYTDPGGGAATLTRDGDSAVERGSGVTLMSYGARCPPDDVGERESLFFHSLSIDQMQTRLVATGCGSLMSTGLFAPVVNAGPDHVIPKLTPFSLRATAQDADTEAGYLAYAWEQMDVGCAEPFLVAPDCNQNGGDPTCETALAAQDDGQSPLFRWLRPAEAMRQLPSAADLYADMSDGNPAITGDATQAERLPATNRVLHFRCSVRDYNNTAGGVGHDDMTVSVHNTPSPFVVYAPYVNVLPMGALQVEWEVADTNQAPVSCANVRITLSVDNGETWPYLLAAATPNDGEEFFLAPEVLTNSARLRVEAVDNIFFAVSRPFPIGFEPDTAIFWYERTLRIQSPALTTINEGMYSPFGLDLETKAHSVPGGHVSATMAAGPGVLKARSWSSISWDGSGPVGAFPQGCSPCVNTSWVITRVGMLDAFVVQRPDLLGQIGTITAVLTIDATYDSSVTEFPPGVCASGTSDAYVRIEPDLTLSSYDLGGDFFEGDYDDRRIDRYHTTAYNQCDANLQIIASYPEETEIDGTLEPAIVLTIPFVFGGLIEVASDLTAEIRLSGGRWVEDHDNNPGTPRIAHYVPGDTTADADLSQTVRWGGITVLGPDGQPITDYQLVSASGTDYRFPITDCPGDWDMSGATGIRDIFLMIEAWFIAQPRADWNDSGVHEIGDILAFLTDWFAGC